MQVFDALCHHGRMHVITEVACFFSHTCTALPHLCVVKQHVGSTAVTKRQLKTLHVLVLKHGFNTESSFGDLFLSGMLPLKSDEHSSLW